MRDWSLIARALAPDLSPADVERILPPLNTLEAAFRPLTPTLAVETEPAVLFHIGPEDIR